MTIDAQKLTAEALLSAPRLSPIVPSHDGKLGIYTASTHIFGQSTTKEVHMIDIQTGISHVLSTDDKIHDIDWIPGSSADEVLYLRSEEKGKTQFVVANARDVSRKHHHVAELDAPISNLKLKQLDDGTIAVVFTGLVGGNGRLYNDEAVERETTARVFDNCNIRVWNELYKPQLYGLWYTTLTKEKGEWTLSEPFHNTLQDTTLEVAGMYDIAVATDNFDICSQGIAFLARDAACRNVRTRMDTYPFFSSIASYNRPPAGKPRIVSLPDAIGSGESTCVRISPDGSTIGFLHAPGVDINNRRLYMAQTGGEKYVAVDALAAVPEVQKEATYDPPTAFEFAGSLTSLIIQRQKRGREILLHLDLESHSDPTPITTEGVVQAFYPLKHGDWSNLLVTSSSFIDSCLCETINIKKPSERELVVSVTKNGARFGLSRQIWSEAYFKGADGLDIHTFILRPSNFDENKRYPWVLLPHGGPALAWTDAWSTRWNMACWAEQGYIIVLPNISGSTGFGLDFTNLVNDQWGGKPYQDLLKLIAYLETLPYLDPAKAVLAGSSYGGYLVSWLLGHDIINKFCCAIWHNGMFSLPTFMLQSDLPADDAAFGHRPPFLWDNAAALERYNPARPELLRRYASSAPPTLVIHSEKDYRCPITEGLALFQTLQAQGVPSRFLTFEDECHWVLKPENSLVWHQTVWDWMRRCVDGEIKRGDTQW